MRKTRSCIKTQIRQKKNSAQIEKNSNSQPQNSDFRQQPLRKLPEKRAKNKPALNPSTWCLTIGGKVRVRSSCPIREESEWIGCQRNYQQISRDKISSVIQIEYVYLGLDFQDAVDCMQ